MASGHGWVAECVSTDHTVVPDLSGWVEPTPAIDTETLPSETFASDPFAPGAFGALAPEVPSEPPARSGIRGVLVGGLAVAALAVGGFFAWPAISALLEAEQASESPPALALSSEPTQKFVISDGSIYLEGSVPDAATSKFIEQAAENALGTERVINNFEISDQAVFDPSKPVLLSVAETVLFPTGQARVKEEYAPLIDLAVELMNSRPKTILRIVGHTDDQGPEDVNWELSVDRANAVATEIERRGVEGERLTVDGRGESEPIMTNDTQEGRSANRRVEFLISGLLD